MSRYRPWSDKVTALLAQFPGPVTLYPSKLKWVALFGPFTLLLACSILLLWPALVHLSGNDLAVVCGVFVAPILMMIWGAAATLGRGFPRLRLDREGLGVSLSKRGYYRVRWSEAAQFRSFWCVAFYVDSTPPQNRWDGFNRAYLGGDYRLWLDTFGLGAKDFTRLMNAWRERALAEQR
jgi:hypothetical protein